MSSIPQVRALTSQVALAHLGTLPPTLREVILRDAGDVESAREAFQFGWIPFRLQIGILDAMRRHMTPEQWKTSQRALMLAYLDKPVLRGLFDTAVRMLGMSVTTLSKWAPRGYDALFKHAGALRFEAGPAPGELSLVLDCFPPELFASGSFAEALSAAFEVIFTLVKTAGQVRVSELDLKRGHARYTLLWDAAK